MVGCVVPRSEIGRRAAKNACRHMTVELAAEVSAINRVEAHCPGKIEAAKAGDPGGIRIVVVQLHRVGLVERVLDGRLLELRMAIHSTAPITLQIPVGSENVGHVALEGNSALCTCPGSRAGTGDAAVVDADTPLNAASGRSFERGLRPSVGFDRHDRLDRHVNGCKGIGCSRGARTLGVFRS